MFGWVGHDKKNLTLHFGEDMDHKLDPRMS